jgi:hypothetical protein
MEAGHHASHTMTSNFTGMSEIEELRRQLAESSVELEENRDLNRRRLALQQKQLEEYYETLASYRTDEKQVRVRVNQIENELEHNLKRLDIICKSKGLPRPQRTLLNSQPKKDYVSPYRRAGASPAGQRSSSNGGSAKRPAPYSYTPPNRRTGSYSPAGSQTRYKSPATKPAQAQSPAARSNGSTSKP